MITEFLENRYDEVEAMDFYRDIFPIGSFEKKGVFEEGKYNGIAVSIASGNKRVKRFTVTDDLDTIEELIEGDDFCLMSPISYIGKNRKSDNARHLYALAIDVDGITDPDRMRFFLHQCEEGHEMLWGVWGLPKPTYLVSSGTGIHIYYVFKEPIALFPSAVKPLEDLKRRITWQAWTQGASALHDNVQYESLFQGFRMVGSITKVGTRVRAFKVGEKVDVAYLNKFVPESYQIDDTLSYKSDLSLKKAKELYPDWYERRVVKKEPKGTWKNNRALFDWWYRTAGEGWLEGHRYWCIMALASYAVKCGIEYEELEEKAFSLLPVMNKNVKEPFTEDDVIHALEAYNASYITYPIDTISERTAIKIEKNKRNGRSQKEHLKRARAVQEIDYPNGEWRKENGRKAKKAEVYIWRQEHKNGTKAECRRDTGMSWDTVRKWWDYRPTPEELKIEFYKPENEAVTAERLKKYAEIMQKLK